MIWTPSSIISWATVVDSIYGDDHIGCWFSISLWSHRYASARLELRLLCLGTRGKASNVNDISACSSISPTWAMPSCYYTGLRQRSCLVSIQMPITLGRSKGVVGHGSWGLQAWGVGVWRYGGMEVWRYGGMEVGGNRAREIRCIWARFSCLDSQNLTSQYLSGV